MLCKSTGSQLLGCEPEMDLSSVLITAVKKKFKLQTKSLINIISKINKLNFFGVSVIQSNFSIYEHKMCVKMLTRIKAA